MKETLKLQYLDYKKLIIPKLKNYPMGITLPFSDHVKGGLMPLKYQVINVTRNEASDLIRTWGEKVFKIEKPIKEKKTELEVINGESRI